jgi:hypothetical protein
MKKVKFLLAVVAVLVSGVAMAQKITAADVTIEQAGGTADLLFCIESEQESTLAEFFLTMPEGISIEQEDDEYLFDLGSMCQRSHNGSVLDKTNGDIYVLVKNESGKNFKTTSGELITLPLVAASDILNGTYEIKVTGCNITNLVPERINTEREFTIKVTVGPTGIDEVNGAEGALADGKYLQKGQVFIKKGDKVFTADGNSK